MKKAIKCNDPYGFEGAIAEANETGMMRFANKAGNIADDLGDWLDQSTNKFHVGDYLSQEDINTLMEANEILLDVKMMIFEDLRRS
jgi:hypothetical protein